MGVGDEETVREQWISDLVYKSFSPNPAPDIQTDSIGCGRPYVDKALLSATDLTSRSRCFI